MMRLIVLTDTHGHRMKLKRIIAKEWQRQERDGLIYLGDGISDILPYRADFRVFHAVRGNCDLLAGDMPLQQVITIGQTQAFICHGHVDQVKENLEQLVRKTLARNATWALYGHTHVPSFDYISGVTLLNPGPASEGHYAILRLDETGHVRAELKKL